MGTFATSLAVIAKSGAGTSSGILEGWKLTSEFESWLAQAEATVSAMSRYDYVANSAAITTNKLPLLKEITANLAAIEAVKYSMGGYTSRTEAEDVINVLRDAALRGLNLIRDQKGTTFIKR